MKLSSLQTLGPAWRRVLPVESLQQFISYVAATLIGFLLLQLILFLMKLPAATPIVLLGAFSGSSVILRQTVSTRFSIECNDAIATREAERRLTTLAASYGYGRADHGRPHGAGATRRYITRMPHWLAWRENAVEIETLPNVLRVTAPALIARLLHGRLERDSASQDA